MAETQYLSVVNFPIQKVTVYADRAEIVRKFDVSLKPGITNVRLENIVNYAGPESVRVEGSGSATIHDVSFDVKPSSINDETNPRIVELRKTLEGKKSSLREVSDVITVYKKQIEAIDNLVLKRGESKNFTFDEEAQASLQRLFEFHKTEILRLQNNVSTQERLLENIQREIKKIQEEIDQILTPNSSNNVIIVQLENDSTGEEASSKIELEVSYQVYNAFWSPSYDIRFDSGNDQLKVTYSGQVTQHTGEDWKDVELVLSTASPNFGGELPKLGTTIVRFPLPPALAHPQPMQYQAFAADGMFGGAPERQMRAKSLRHTVAHVEQTNSLAASFLIPSKKTLLSDSSEVKVVIMSKAFDAVLTYNTVPKKDTNVYALTTIINDTDYLFLPGKARIFFDNALVTSTYLNETTASGAKFEVSLGIDRAIKVVYKPTDKFQTQAGIVSKTATSSNHQRIVVRNTKSSSVLLNIYEPVPKSTDEKIKVKLLAPVDVRPLPVSTEPLAKPTSGVFINDLNNVKWSEELGPGEEKEFVIKWSVDYPQTEKIEYQEEY